MFKKLLALSFAVMLAVGFSSCKADESEGSGKSSGETTQKETRIHNSLKDTLPDFGFDSEPVEKYEEGVSYSFSAECSDRDFNKYIDAVKKSGYDVNPAEGNGYYKAHNAEKFLVEIVLKDGVITVYVER